jgi:hypothetical protein
MYAGVPTRIPVAVCSAPGPTTSVGLALAQLDLRIADEEDVVRLQIAVNDASVVRHREPGRDLARERRRRALGHDPGADPGAQALALEQLHHDVGAAITGAPEVDQLDHARVPDRCDRARLVEEPSLDRLVREVLGVEDLDGDLVAEHPVLPHVDGGHTSLPEWGYHAVVTEFFADHPVGFYHVAPAWPPGTYLAP